MRLISAALALSLLAGCSSWRPDAQYVRPVPEDRLLSHQQARDSGGQIQVTRDFGGMGSGCYIAVLVDRQLAARIGVGEQASFQVPVGTRVLGIGIDPLDDTLCGMGRLRRELAVRVEAGSQQQFRIISQNRGGFDILPIEP